MRPFILALSIATWALASLEDSGAASKAYGQSPTLLIVHQDADLRDVSRFGVATSASARLRSGTTLIGLQQEPEGTPPRPGWRVVTLGEPQRHGWVRAGVVSTISARTKELKAKAVALRADDTGQKQSLPEIILIQDSPAIQQAWREVSIAISENEVLPENERLPEPYFARAEIWASVRNYTDSLQDYLTAIRYARTSNRDILSYSEYFDRLYDVAERLQAMPVTAAGAESLPYLAAHNQYGDGYSKFFVGDLLEALDRFDSAIRLAPDQPVYWYFRAITHKRLGDEERAQHDALMGASFERQFESWRRRSLNGALHRVQGPMRTWLESYRLGSPNNRVLIQYEVRLSALEDIR